MVRCISEKRRGFTLIEMSVVLVILGLLVGAIVVGKNLIRTSQVRSTITEYQRYANAIATFKEKYGALPGDLATATNYWGTNPTGCPPGYDAVKRTETCNGNGDGNLSTWDWTWVDFYGQFTAWQHLADAGLIPGQFVGASSSGVQGVTLGMNAPKARLPNSGWSFYPLAGTWMAGKTPNNVFANDYSTVLLFSSPYNASNFIQPILSGPEAYSIDKKIDDGRPGYGIVSTWKNSPGVFNFTCLTNDTQTTSEYVVNVDNDLRCTLIFKYD